MSEDLVRAIETGPASRELSDRVLIACGWRRVWSNASSPPTRVMITPAGEDLWGGEEHKIPDPTRDLNDIAALERECGARICVGHLDDEPDIITAGCSVYCPAKDGRRFADAEARGDHAECRARAASLIRALAAAGRTPVDAPSTPESSA